MTDDYCATLCLHWAQAGKIPGAATDEIYSATQFSFTCWCGTAADASSLVRVDDKQCNTPCEGDKTMMCGGPSLNHVMRVTCSRWGWTFVGTIIACMVGYMAMGALYVHRTQGVPLTKGEFLAGSLLPNKGFWTMFRGLVSDGIRFSRAKLRGEAAPAVGYSPVADTRRLGPGEVKQRNPEKEDAQDRHRRAAGSTKTKRTKEKTAKHRDSSSGGGSKSSKKLEQGASRTSRERGSVEESDNRAEEPGVAGARELTEQRDAGGLHASQAKIKVVGINSD